MISIIRGLFPGVAPVSPAADQPPPSVVHGRGARFLTFGAFAAMLLGSKLWLIGAYGNATPYWDQWDAEAANLYKPFLEGRLGWAHLFTPHCEHHIFTTRLLALGLLTLNGIWNPLLQMVVNAVLHIATLGFGIALLARVVGRRHLSALLLFALVLCGVPCAWENTLAGFQVQFYLVLLFSIACLWLTVTRDPLSAGWWAGTAYAILAFLSFSSGICAPAAAAIVGVLFYASGLRRTRKQLLAVAILAGLFVLGVALTPTVVGHARLKAASFPQFLQALAAILGWPVSSDVFAAIIVNLPALVFVGVMLWKRPPALSRKWFLLALIVWTLAQTAIIAYGRAAAVRSSRYLDLFAIGILVNFACSISIVQGHSGKRYGWTILGAAIWAGTVLICLGVYAGRHIPAALSAKRDIGLAQEFNTRAYLASGDLKHLKDKPYLHVPYPHPDRLVSILASPEIRAILPANLRVPPGPPSAKTWPADESSLTTASRSSMAVGRLDALTMGLLANYHLFLLAGFAAAVSLLMQCGLTNRMTESAGEACGAKIHVPADNKAAA